MWRHCHSKVEELRQVAEGKLLLALAPVPVLLQLLVLPLALLQAVRNFAACMPTVFSP